MRQHGHHAAGKIHRGATRAGLGVKRRALAHVVAHIGYRHDQAEAVLRRLGVHRVVEVLRILAIYGDQRQAAQIHTPGGFGLIDAVAMRLGIAHGLGRKLPWQRQLCYRCFRGQRHRLFRVQQPFHPRLAGLTRFRIAQHARDHPTALAGAVQVGGRHRAIQVQSAVYGLHAGTAAADLHRGEECARAARDHLHQLPAPAPVMPLLGRDAHLVAMHQPRHFLRRQENAFHQIVAADEAESGAIGADHSHKRAGRSGGPAAARRAPATGAELWRSLRGLAPGRMGLFR